MGKIRPYKSNKFSNSFLLGVNSKLLSRIMFLLGVPGGCKVKQEYSIPHWILEDRNCFMGFVKRYFACEGCVSIEGKISFVEISMSKSGGLIENGCEFLEQMRHGMKRFFDIAAMNVFASCYSLGRDGIKTIGLKLRIKNLGGMIKFYKEMGFDNKVKQDKLLRVIRLKMPYRDRRDSNNCVTVGSTRLSV